MPDMVGGHYPRFTTGAASGNSYQLSAQNGNGNTNPSPIMFDGKRAGDSLKLTAEFSGGFADGERRVKVTLGSKAQPLKLPNQECKVARVVVNKWDFRKLAARTGILRPVSENPVSPTSPFQSNLRIVSRCGRDSMCSVRSFGRKVT